MKRLTFSAVGFDRYGKTTWRAAFLREMERSALWCELELPPKNQIGRGSCGWSTAVLGSS